MLRGNRDKSKTDNIKLGVENGLEIILDAETYDYGWTFGHTEGFLAGVHQPDDYPVMGFSTLDLSPGFNHKVAVDPTIRNTKESALRFGVDDRKCHLDEDVRFRHLPRAKFRYSKSNCMAQAVYNKIRKECNCHRGINPQVYDRREDDIKTPPSPESTVDIGQLVEDLEQCQGLSLKCYNEKLSEYGKLDIIKSSVGGEAGESASAVLPCYPACSDQTFQETMTASTYPNRNSLERNKKFYCLVFRKMRATCSRLSANGNKRKLFKRRYGKQADKFCHQFAIIEKNQKLFRDDDDYGRGPSVRAKDKVDDRISGDIRHFFAKVCRVGHPIILEEALSTVSADGEDNSIVPPYDSTITDGYLTLNHDAALPPACNVTSPDGSSHWDPDCLQARDYMQSFVYRYATDNLIKLNVFLKDTSIDVIEVSLAKMTLLDR